MSSEELARRQGEDTGLKTIEEGLIVLEWGVGGGEGKSKLKT